MTVSELIEKLQRIPTTAEITIENWDSYCSYNASTGICRITYDAKENEVFFNEEEGSNMGMEL